MSPEIQTLRVTLASVGTGCVAASQTSNSVHHSELLPTIVKYMSLWLFSQDPHRSFSANWCLFRGISGEGSGTPLQYSCLENLMDGGAWWAVVHGITEGWTRLSDFPFTFHFHALEKEMATHSSVLAWRIPGMGEPGGLPSMGSHRVRHDWNDLAAAAASIFTQSQIPLWPHYLLGMTLSKLLVTSWEFSLLVYNTGIIYSQYFKGVLRIKWDTVNLRMWSSYI